jgi:threonine/homoserine/homoserine lactone efflux protein
MSAAGLAAVAGCAIGFVGAIPPGPAGMAIASHAAEGRERRAIAVALGAATVDVVLCAAIALGAGPTLARLVEAPIVRLFLAVAYAALGAFLLAETLLRRAPRRAAPVRPAATHTGYLSGVLRGVTNPSLLANWTLVVTALTAAGALRPGATSGLAFALGVGAGVVGWFASLAHLVSRAPRAKSAPWLRAAAGLTGVLLLVAGGVGTVRALFG